MGIRNIHWYRVMIKKPLEDMKNNSVGSKRENHYKFDSRCHHIRNNFHHKHGV